MSLYKLAWSNPIHPVLIHVDNTADVPPPNVLRWIQLLLYVRKSITPPVFFLVFFIFSDKSLPPTSVLFLGPKPLDIHLCFFFFFIPLVPREKPTALWCGLGREQQAGDAELWQYNGTSGGRDDKNIISEYYETFLRCTLCITVSRLFGWACDVLGWSYNM